MMVDGFATAFGWTLGIVIAVWIGQVTGVFPDFGSINLSCEVVR